MTTQVTPQEHQLPNRSSEFFSPGIFWQPRFLAESGTGVLQHVPILFWLVGMAQPRRSTVIGVRDGVAMFAICQGMDKLNLGGRCHGFGIWSDIEAGEVLSHPPQALCDHAAQIYADIARLSVCKDYTVAELGLRPQSQDLMFADLREVSEDVDLQATIETWQDCLAPGGLLILHGTDTDLTDDQAKVLNAVTSDGRGLKFDIGPGLLILSQGDDHPPQLRALIDASPNGTIGGEVELLFRRLGQANETAFLVQASDKVQQKLKTTEKALKEVRSAYKGRSLKLAEIEARNFELQQENDALREAFETAKANMEELRKIRFKETAALTARLERIRKAFEATKADMARLKEGNEELLASTSWRMTAPIRKVKSALSRQG